MGGKYVAVPLTDIKTDNNRVTLDRTKEQLQQIAAYQLENPNTAAGSTTSPPLADASADKGSAVVMMGRTGTSVRLALLGKMI